MIGETKKDIPESASKKIAEINMPSKKCVALALASEKATKKIG